MKYLINDLYYQCFLGSDYDKNEDKFLIGYLNKTGTKLKDVTTGQIVESGWFPKLKTLANDDYSGQGSAIGYMTGFRANSASLYQCVLAKTIDAYLSCDVIDTKQIAKIKDIMNNEIIKNHNREIKLQGKFDTKKKKLESFSIDESERDF
jgi:hypothetical protein